MPLGRLKHGLILKHDAGFQEDEMAHALAVPELLKLGAKSCPLASSFSGAQTIWDGICVQGDHPPGQHDDTYQLCAASKLPSPTDFLIPLRSAKQSRTRAWTFFNNYGAPMANQPYQQMGSPQMGPQMGSPQMGSPQMGSPPMGNRRWVILRWACNSRTIHRRETPR